MNMEVEGRVVILKKETQAHLCLSLVLSGVSQQGFVCSNCSSIGFIYTWLGPVSILYFSKHFGLKMIVSNQVSAYLTFLNVVDKRSLNHILALHFSHIPATFKGFFCPPNILADLKGQEKDSFTCFQDTWSC